MTWGSAFSAVLHSATDAAKSAVWSAAQSARGAYDYAQQKAQQAANYVGAKAAHTYEHVWGQSPTPAPAPKSPGPISSSAQSGYRTVQSLLSPKPAGKPIQTCPFNQSPVLPAQPPLSSQYATASPALAAPRQSDITPEQLKAIMPGAKQGDIDTYLPLINKTMADNGIVTRPQQAAFLAHISVESGQLSSPTENLKYSAKGMHDTWPRRFPSEEFARYYVGDPESIANIAYSNKNGNGDIASGDGYTYRGRGLLQITGRANYAELGYENNPEELGTPAGAASSAGAHWASRNLNEITEDKMNYSQFENSTKIINGGTHGLPDRWSAYQRGLTVFGIN